MKKNLFFSIFFLIIFFYNSVLSQNNKKDTDPNHFDEKAAILKAKAKGIKPSEINGYVQFLKTDFYSKKALENQGHKHSPYENSENINDQVIYLNGENKPMSIGCPNAGFENYDFTGWTGTKGTYSGTQASPVYALTPGINTPAGNNTPLGNSANDQTILSIPPTNPAYPSCIGYDSIACPAGGPLISEIPFVSPYSLDGVSCRLLGAYGGAKVAKLKYIMSVTPTNKSFSYSYAIVLNDGHSTDPLTHQPYFKVTVKDQNGNPIFGCQPFEVDATGATSDPTFKTSHLLGGGPALPMVYRPWHLVSIDLSSPTHSLVTSVSIEFEVAGCTASGHIGYAYVDAECGAGGISASYCNGSNAILTAPAGYTNYQWFDNAGSPIPAPAGTSATLTITTPTVGNTYSVSMSTPGGCTVTLTKTISFFPVTIQNVNAAPSCAGGNSGIAAAYATGGTGVYSYTWTNINTGQDVSFSQTATGLAPGSYSVFVNSPPCGQDSYNFSVGTSPPFYMNQTKSFCGNSTFIVQPGGTDYFWYQGTTLIAAPQGTNDTLYIPIATAGDKYTVVFKNAQGCKDSIIYSLAQVAGGSISFSNINNVCPNASNGTAVLNLITPYSAPYHYLVISPTGSTVVNTSTTSTNMAIGLLSAGTYSVVINDGVCIYNNTLSISTIQTNFTVTPTNTVLCFPQEATLNLNFGDLVPTNCGLSTTGSCSSPGIFQVGNGSVQNTSTTLPSVFGNHYKNARHQLLFTSGELTSAGITPGKLSSIAFDVVSTLPNQVPTANNTSIYSSNPFNFTVKIKCTNANVLTSTFDNTGLVQVYSGSFHPVVGWNTINFNQAYDWPAGTNIIIDICYDLQPFYTSNPVMNGTNVGANRCAYYQSDITQVCGINTTGIATTSTTRPNVRIGNCTAVNPADYTVTVSPNGTITSTFTANDSIRVAPTSVIPPTGTGSIVYTIEVTNPIGLCKATQTVEILYPPLTTVMSPSITNTSLCEGESTTLSATGAANYNWYYSQNGSLTSISTATSITVIPPAVGVNTYVVTGNAPCPSSIPDTDTIIVTVKPMANLFITPLVDITKCLNKSFIFSTGVGSSVPANAGTPYTYSWTTLPGNNPASGVNTSSSYTTTTNTTETLVITVSGLCSNTVSDTVVVKNFADDLTTSMSNSVLTCPNKPVTFSSTTTGGYPVYNYYWTVNATPVSNLPDLIYTSPSTGGVYTVSLTVIDSCGYQRSDSDIIVVLPNTLNISILDSVSVCGNTEFTLNSSTSGGYLPYSYIWTTGSDILSTDQTLTSITPSTEGNYTIVVTASDSCGYQSSDFEVINVLPPCMVIIPNVITSNGDNVNDFFKIKNLEYHPNTSMVIFDRWGRKVYESSNYNNEWKAEGVSDGTYFYVIDVPDDKKYTGFVTVFKGK